jgi:hypothetical protein
VDLIGLAQDRNRWRTLVNSVLNLLVPWNAGKLSSVLSGSAQLHIYHRRNPSECTGILSNYRTQRFGNWICFHPQVRVERHLLCWAHYRDLPEGVNKSSFRNDVFFWISECWS